jgi:hypothetical protein
LFPASVSDTVKVTVPPVILLRTSPKKSPGPQGPVVGELSGVGDPRGGAGVGLPAGASEASSRVGSIAVCGAGSGVGPGGVPGGRPSGGTPEQAERITNNPVTNNRKRKIPHNI